MSSIKGSPKSLAKAVRTARSGMTIARLAKKARVSNRTISIIEENKLPTALKADSATRRKAKAWALIVSKIALALKHDAEAWIKLAGMPLSPEEIKEVASEAAKQLSRSRRDDTLEKLHRELKVSDGGGVSLDVHLLASETGKGQHHFFNEICNLLLKTIDPRIEPRFTTEVNTFEDVMEGLSSTPLRHRLVVGAFQMVGRTHHRVIFVPIPGWRIRLGALALRGSDCADSYSITWEDIRRSGETLPLNIRSQFKLLVIEHEAADVYLRSFCNYSPSQVVRIKNYQVHEAVEVFHRELQSNHKAIFVVGEYEASVIRHELHRRFQRQVIDIAAKCDSVPRYQLSLVVADSDSRWAETLKNAIIELFRNAGTWMAEYYGRYMLSVIRELIEAETGGGIAKDTFKVIVGLKKEISPSVLRPEIAQDSHKTTEQSIAVLPSFLQLGDFDFPVSAAFRKGLCDYLRAGLIRDELITATESFAPYFHNLAPWLQTADEKTLNVADKIRRIMSRMRQDLKKQRQLIEKLQMNGGSSNGEE